MPTGVYTDGGVEFGYYYESGYDGFSSHTDLTLGYSGSGVGSAPIGFELGIEYSTRNFGSSTEEMSINGILFYDSAFGRLSVGTPSVALDDYLMSPRARKTDELGFVLGFYSRSYTGFVRTYIDEPVYGVRFDGSTNDVNYGISYHTTEDGSLETVTGGASYSRDNYVIAAGFEQLFPISQTGLYGSAEFDFGQYGANVYVSNGGLIDANFAAIEGEYNPTDSLELLVGFSAVEGADTSLLYAEAEYRFLDGGYAGVNLTTDSDFSYTAYDVYAGWRYSYGS
ncbi:MAG: hypothetical protein KAS85_09750 [Rhodobacteraceae bacterium]|nr:hypothetical protein [Paracoccaceae bacterium]